MENKIDTIILAGGKGTRLKSYLGELPKPLAPVSGRPFLDILLCQLADCQYIRRVVLAVGYQAQKIIERYAQESPFGLEIVFSREETLLGTGGAVRLALRWAETETIMVLNGDSYLELDWEDFLAAHCRRRALLTLALVAMEDTRRYGTVQLDEDQHIVAFREKRASDSPGLINAGVYLLEKRLLTPVRQGVPLSLEEDLLPGFIRERAYGYVASGRFIDIGVPEAYLQAPIFFKE